MVHAKNYEIALHLYIFVKVMRKKNWLCFFPDTV